MSAVAKKTYKTYKLAQDCVVQNAWQGERYELSFKAGTHTPKSEAEEHALQMAVEAQTPPTEPETEEK